MEDKRFSINKEFCGYAKIRYVVRFCNNWVGQALTKKKAISIRNNHIWWNN